MYNIAFLGDERLLTFYRPAGIVVFSPETEREVLTTLRRLQKENYSIVFVTEAVYRMAPKVIDEFNQSFLPAITILPGFGEHDRLGLARLSGLSEAGIPETGMPEAGMAETGQSD